MSQPPLGKETLAILQILSAGILWGLVGPLVKMMELHGSTAASTSFIRMLFAFLIMTAFTAMKFGPKALIVDKRTLVACAVLLLLHPSASAPPPYAGHLKWSLLR